MCSFKKTVITTTTHVLANSTVKSYKRVTLSRVHNQAEQVQEEQDHNMAVRSSRAGQSGHLQSVMSSIINSALTSDH